MSSENNSSLIPASHLQNWMHKRIEIPRESKEDRIIRYEAQPISARRMDYLIGKLFYLLHFNNEAFRWALYRVIMKLKYLRYKIYNRIEVRGKENIPKNGAIFIMNHWGRSDVVMFLSAFKEPVGCFTAVGNGFLADLLENYFNFVPRIGDGNVMIEKMIQTIITKTKYFAVWPEGTASREEKVLEPFSGIIKVYATLNHKKNIIPIVPIVMQNTNAYDWHKPIGKPKKIRLTFLQPFYFPREWLKPLDEGGKTPRFMVNYAMMKIARKLGQKSLSPNRVLNWRRKAREANMHKWN